MFFLFHGKHGVVCNRRLRLMANLQLGRRNNLGWLFKVEARHCQPRLNSRVPSWITLLDLWHRVLKIRCNPHVRLRLKPGYVHLET